MREREVPVARIQCVVRRTLPAFNGQKAYEVEIAMKEGKSLSVGTGYPKASLDWLASYLHEGVHMAQK